MICPYKNIRCSIVPWKKWFLDQYRFPILILISMWKYHGISTSINPSPHGQHLQNLMRQVRLLRLMRLPNQALPVPQQGRGKDVVAVAAQEDFPGAGHDQTSLFEGQNWEDSPRLSMEKMKLEGVFGFFWEADGRWKAKKTGSSIRNSFKIFKRIISSFGFQSFWEWKMNKIKHRDPLSQGWCKRWLKLKCLPHVWRSGKWIIN